MLKVLGVKKTKTAFFTGGHVDKRRKEIYIVNKQGGVAQLDRATAF